ncbi:MAG: ESPR-type extended signal peptide-containing protein [Negativicoccus succinicivorans]|nr:ESPR-type extended signal peptide-containing protein [Negativicoccus succinicivorans]
MNKIYKLIWSKVKNCWVVTSELAKGHGKNKSRVQNGLLAAFVTATLLAGGVTDVQALTQQEKDEIKAEVARDLLDKIINGDEIPGVTSGVKTIPGAIALRIQYANDISGEIGKKLKKDGLALQYFSVRPDYIEPSRDYLNRYAKSDWTNVDNDGAFGAHSMALGYRAFSEAKHGVAIGRSSLAGGSNRDGDYGGDGDVAIGNMAWALGDKAVSIGDKALSADKSIAIGIQAEAGANKNDPNSIQRDPQTNLPYVVSDIAKMNSAIAIGRDTKAWGHQSVSIGGSAKATGKYALSFGNSAEASAMDSFAFGNYASAKGIGAIAIGSNYDQSSDAAKAYSGDTIAIGRGSVAGDKNDTTTAYNTVAIGVNAKAVPDYTSKKVKDAVLLGANTTVKQERGTAVGANAYVDGASGAAFGDYASVVADEGLAIGKNAKVAYNSAKSIAIGSGAEVKNENANPSERAVAVGTGAVVGGKSSDAIAIGTGAKTQEGAKGSIVIGKGSVVKGYDSVAIGTNASTQWYNSVAIGNGAQAISSDGIALGSGSKATVYPGNKGYDPYIGRSTIDANPGAAWLATKSALSVGDVGNNITRQITSVAAGSNDTDAVNVAQLKKMRTYTDTKMNAWVLKATSDKGAAAEGKKINNTDNAVTFDVEKNQGLTVTRTGATIKYGVDSRTLADHIIYNVIENINGGGIPINNISAKFSISGADAATKKNLTLSKTSTPNIQFLGTDDETTVTIDGDAINPTVTVGLDSKFTQRVTTNETNIKANTDNITALTGRVDTAETNISELQKGWTLSVARGDDSATDNEATVEGTSKKIGTGDKVTLKAGRGVKLKQDGANVQIGLKFIDMDPAGWGFNDAKAIGGGSLAVGQNSVAGAHQATAVGLDTKSDEYGVALGAASEAGKSAVAIGNNALANGDGSIAIGSATRKVEGYPDKGYRKVDSEDAIAIGTETAVDGSSKNATAVGPYADIANSNFSTALGNSAKVKDAAYGTALGNFSRVENAAFGTALGNNAAVIDAQGGVAIGAHSVANRNGFMPGYNPTGEQWSNFSDYLKKTGQTDAYNQAAAELQAAQQALQADEDNPELQTKFNEAKSKWNKIFGTWAGSQGAVSIGDEQAGFTRQLTGVAAGTEDTDAVNVAQLKVLNTKVDKNAVHYFSVKADDSAKPAGTNWKNDGASGDKAIAIGQKAGATGTSDIAIGTEAQATGGWGVAIGQAAKAQASTAVAMAYGAEAKGNNSLAIGILSEAKTNDSTAYGREAKALGDVALAVGAQTKAEGNHSSAIGYEATTDSTAWNGTAIGRGAYIGKQAADGTTPNIGVSNNYYTPVDDDTVVEAGKETKNSTAVGFGAKSFGYQNTALGAGAEAFDTNTVAVGVMSKAIGHYANALGKQARAEGKNSTAIGHFARALGESSMALGDYAITSTLDGTGKVNQSVALGSHARVAADNSLALGYNSLASIADDVDTEAYLSKEAFKKENGVVSVGNKAYTIGDETIAQNYRRITNVAGGAADNDAVNVAQLKVVNAKADKNETDITNLKNTVNANGKATKVTVDGQENSQDGNLKIKKTDTDGQLTYDLSLNDEITIGKDGKDGKIGINGKDGVSADITVGKGEAGVDGKDGITRIIYKDEKGNHHEVATLDDGLKFKGDNDTVVIRKLNTQLNIEGGAKADELSDNNIGVVGTAGDNGGMKVKLSKNLKGLTSAEFKDGDNITNITAENVTITRKEGKVDLWELNKTVNNITAGTTDVSSWKLQANGADERTITKDSVVNFKNGTKTEVTVNGNDITVDLNEATQKQINDNTTNINNIDKRVTTIENNIDQKIEGAKVTVDGDDKTGVKVENTAGAGKAANYKVSLEDKVKVGNVAIDGKDGKGEITGLTNTTVDAADFATKGRAATEEQLKAAMGKVQAQGRTTVKGSGNITVTPGTAGASEYTVGLAKDISVDSVTAKEYKVGDKTYINKDGINANGNKVTNVADGKVSADSTDAVNGRQLYAVSQQIEKSAMGNVQKELSEMGDRVNELRDESREGDAMNAALAALKPLDFDPYNRSQVMAGVSTYKGKQAVAVGLAHYSNEDTLVHAGIAYGGSSDLMANAGISWRFGDKDDRDAKAERDARLPQYADGPISSVYVMQDEMAALRAENQSLKEENQEIKRQVEMLMKHAGLNA